MAGERVERNTPSRVICQRLPQGAGIIFRLRLQEERSRSHRTMMEEAEKQVHHSKLKIVAQTLPQDRGTAVRVPISSERA